MNFRHAVAGSLAALATLGLASIASAEPELHDGFFLQLELGPGYVSMPGTTESGSSSVDVSIKGVAGMGGLLIGGTPSDGLVIGGATQGHYVSSPTVEVDGTEVDTDDALSLGVIGPFVQFYPDPAAGLNLRLLAGFASASGTDDDADESATGFGLVAAVGHDWWVGEEWSLGVAGRFTYANLKYESEIGDVTITQKYNAIAPGVLFTVTYH